MPVPRMQIELELRRIVSSKVFRPRGSLVEEPRSVRLLTYLVNGTLDGKQLKETELQTDFFGISGSALESGEVGIVRTDVRRLRDKLDSYFEGAGADDPVIIAIPKGQYRADFTLNPNSRAEQEFRLGFDHVDEETPEHVDKALDHFNKAIKLDDRHANAWAGKASAYLTMTLHAYTEDPASLLADAEAAAEKSVSLDENCWRGHANLGAIYLFRHEWIRADASFATANRIAPLELSHIGGYGPYLVSRGHHEKARNLAEHYGKVGFNDVVLLGRSALIMYALREFDEAKDFLFRACERNPNFWRTHLILAYTYLSLGEPDKAMQQMDEVRYCARANLWPGMRILCLEAAGQADEAEAEFTALLELQKSNYVQPMQLALGRMALRDIEVAVANLGEACDASDPFTCWLHLWAFLDPLRGSRSFRDLLRRRKFPVV